MICLKDLDNITIKILSYLLYKFLIKTTGILYKPKQLYFTLTLIRLFEFNLLVSTMTSGTTWFVPHKYFFITKKSRKCLASFSFMNML